MALHLFVISRSLVPARLFLRRANSRNTPTQHRNYTRGYLHLSCITTRPRWCQFSSSAAATSTTTKEHDSEPLDAFATLQLPRTFQISQDDLKQSYRRLMAELHPDKHTQKPIAEQESLQQEASRVTQSYQLLKQAPARAAHLLQLLGRIDGNGMEEASADELLGASSVSSALLMDVMETREAIDEATSDEELLPLLEANNKKMDEIIERLAEDFDAKNLDKALENTVNLQYYNRISETIQEKMEQ